MPGDFWPCSVYFIWDLQEDALHCLFQQWTLRIDRVPHIKNAIFMFRLLSMLYFNINLTASQCSNAFSWQIIILKIRELKYIENKEKNRDGDMEFGEKSSVKIDSFWFSVREGMIYSMREECGLSKIDIKLIYCFDF